MEFRVYLVSFPLETARKSMLYYPPQLKDKSLLVKAPPTPPNQENELTYELMKIS